MNRNYWLDLFTGKTWDEFLKSGANISGFRLRRRGLAAKIKPGDYFLCYLTRISRFIGVLEVTSPLFEEYNNRIWEDDLFPIRFRVKLIHKLDVSAGIPLRLITNDLSKFRKLDSVNAWGGFLRGSPALFDPTDANIILSEIERAVQNPVFREYDASKYAGRIKPVKTSRAITKISETGPSKLETEQISSLLENITHDEIQWTLLKLGSDLRLSVWVAKNDRNRQYNGHSFLEIPNLLSSLPILINDRITRLVERIDVLWLRNEAIICAFEIEHTTQIYSGLLRMSDLVTILPTITIKLFIVAPDERRKDVMAELQRPTFSKGSSRPLSSLCRFISYSSLKSEIEAYGPRIKRIPPDFLDDIAESC
jgi:hypothetical protein